MENVSEREKSGVCESNEVVRTEDGVCEKDQLREKVNSLHLQFSEYGHNAKKWAQKCMLLLLEIDRYKVWVKKRFDSIYEYSAKLAGLTRDQVNESLRVLGKIENMPALMAVAREKGIYAVRPVAVIATKETDEFWAEKARSMSIGELTTYVRDFRRQEEGHCGVNDAGMLGGKSNICSVGMFSCESGGQGDVSNVGMFSDEIGATSVANSTAISPGVIVIETNSIATSLDDFGKRANGSGGLNVEACQPEEIQVLMGFEPEVFDQLKKIKGDGDWNELMKKFLELREKELEREKPEPVRTESRHIPAEIERYVIERDCGTCAFPGCGRAYEELHHADGFALRRVHDPDWIFCLCEEHHGLAHRGLIENEEISARWWRVRSCADREGARFGLDQKVLEYRMARA